MNELGRESRALLLAARRGDVMGSADKARIRARLQQRIGAGIAAGSALTAGVSVAQAARFGAMAKLAVWLPSAAKAVSVVALAGTTGYSAVYVAQTAHRHPAVVAAHDAKSPEPPSTVGSHPAPRTVPDRFQEPVMLGLESTRTRVSLERSPSRNGIRTFEPPHASATSRSPVAAPGLAALPVGSTSPVAMVADAHASGPHARASVGERRAADAPALAAVADSLSTQVAAIREARAFIRSGDARAALGVLDRVVPEGGGGALEPEAALTRISALCVLGDATRARELAERLEIRVVDPLVRARLRHSCAYDSLAAK